MWGGTAEAEPTITMKLTETVAVHGNSGLDNGSFDEILSAILSGRNGRMASDCVLEKAAERRTQLALSLSRKELEMVFNFLRQTSFVPNRREERQYKNDIVLLWNIHFPSNQMEFDAQSVERPTPSPGSDKDDRH
jgi:hypothetical protein